MSPSKVISIRQTMGSNQYHNILKTYNRKEFIMSDKKVIGFDIDGTLTDYIGQLIPAFIRFYYDKYGKAYDKRKIDATKYDFADIFPDVHDEILIQEFHNSFFPDYVKHGKFRPFVKELFTKLKKDGWEIHVVSARGCNYKPTDSISPEEMERWTVKRFKTEGIPVDAFHIGIDEKTSVMKGAGIQVLVDDAPKQALEVSKTFPVLLADNPFNKKIRGKNIFRITSFHPDSFIKYLNYAVNNVDDWSISYEQQDNLDVAQIKELQDAVLLNAKETHKNILMVFPLNNGDSHTQITDKLVNTVNGGVTVFRLNYLDNPDMLSANPRFKKGDALVAQAMKQANTKRLDLTDTENTDVYLVKCKAIKNLISYAKNHPKQKFIFDGVQLLMLSREELKPIKEYPLILAGANTYTYQRIIHNKYQKDYDPFILLEDLTEVATQIRKWRIISGTTKNEIYGYINRQDTTSDGVDIVRLLKGESAYRPDILASILSRDTYVFGDPHISSKNPEKSDRWIKNINSRVKPTDHLLILGDLDGKKGTGSFELTKKFLNRIHTKNIYLILGNNDPYEIKDYVKLGFKTVTDIAEYQESPQTKVILTHCPYPVEKDEINIHGHIHGSRCYWNLDWHNHYDVWDEDGIPITIGEALDILEEGLYEAVSKNHSVVS